MIRFILSLSLLLTISCGKDKKEEKDRKSHDASQFYNTSQIKVHIYYEAGAEPYINDTMFEGLGYWNILDENLKALFQGRKTNTNIIVPKTLSQMNLIASQNKFEWSLDEAVNLFHTIHSSSSSSDLAVIFVKGFAKQSPSIIGFHVNTKPFVFIFKDVIRSSGTSDPLNLAPKYLEQATVIHELGHALGLVNNGVKMQTPHQDTEHGHHCSNPNCIMFYTHESINGLRQFIQNIIETQSFVMFDDNCLKDVRSF